jgi:predicted negative regulator of RcsB-dependent stress response
VAAVLLVLVVGLAITWWNSRSSNQSGAAWDTFSAALDSRNVAELDRVAETHPHSRVGQWAAVTAGDLLMHEGCETLFSSKASANGQFRRATDDFMQVLDRSSDPTLRERATFGLARAREAQNQLDQAIQRYEEVVKDWPEGTFAPLAQQRLDDLKRKSTKVFYDEFAKYDPKPAYSDNPGKGPAFDSSSLPDNPTVRPGPAKLDDKAAGDIKLPDLGAKLDGAAKDAAKPAPAKTDSKAGSAAKAVEVKPEAKSPPAPTAKPAESKK